MCYLRLNRHSFMKEKMHVLLFCNHYETILIEFMAVERVMLKAPVNNLIIISVSRLKG